MSNDPLRYFRETIKEDRLLENFKLECKKNGLDPEDKSAWLLFRKGAEWQQYDMEMDDMARGNYNPLHCKCDYTDSEYCIYCGLTFQQQKMLRDKNRVSPT